MGRRGSVVVACAASVGAGCLICIARGSRILTPQGLRPIETLAVGDAVYCIDPRTHEVVRSRIAAHRTGVRECMALHAGGRRLVLTSTHPVYDAASGDFRQAGVMVGDPDAQVLVVDGTGVRALSIDRVEPYVGLHEVHDLSVEHPLHDFAAEGIVVHNKSYDDPSYGDSNGEPTAELMIPESAIVGTEVIVDGTGSTDPDGDALNFRFTLESTPRGSEATFISGERVRETYGSTTRFTPDVEGDYRISLEVSDGGGWSERDWDFVSVDSAPADDSTTDASTSMSSGASSESSGASDPSTTEGGDTESSSGEESSSSGSSSGSTGTTTG